MRQTGRTGGGKAPRRDRGRTAAAGRTRARFSAPSSGSEPARPSLVRIPPDHRANLVRTLLETGADALVETGVARLIVLLHAGDEGLGELRLGGHDQGAGELERHMRGQSGVEQAERMVASLRAPLVAINTATG